jgi:hypothetical protein
VRGIKRLVQRIEEISDRGIILTGHVQPPHLGNKSHRSGLPEPVCCRPKPAMTPRASEQEVTCAWLSGLFVYTLSMVPSQRRTSVDDHGQSGECRKCCDMRDPVIHDSSLAGEQCRT